MDDTLMQNSFSKWIAGCQAQVEAALERSLPEASHTPAQLHQAMRYSVLGGGKRMRPLLVYAAGEAVGADARRLDAPACAVEMIHAYSLIHDDLPSMDNDELRRGKPTCHMAYGEAMAILAGDALQALAFELLARDPALDVPPARRIEMIEVLGRASGSLGMAGGQAIDLAAVGKRLSLAELENMHRHKTGALIRASCLLGALARESAGEDTLDALSRFADCVGLAFQIRDDVLDVEGDTASLGKPQGSDMARDKPTYPASVGLDESKRMAAALYEQALQHVSPLGEKAEALRRLAAYIVQRSR
jgi:geranylgeranyl pyrophosphate synthase